MFVAFERFKFKESPVIFHPFGALFMLTPVSIFSAFHSEPINKKCRTLLMPFLKKLLSLLPACLSVAAFAQQTDPVAEPTFTLRVGSDYYEPFNYLDAEGAYAGIDVELANEACRRLGCRAEFITIDWSRKDEYLEEHAVDCLWGSFTMTGREAKYNWAGPYMESRQVVMVWADSKVQSLADLEGLAMAVQATTKPEGFFLNRTLPNVPKIGQLYSLPDIGYAIAAFRKGYADAVAGHENALIQYIPEDQKGQYRIISEPLQVVQLGVAFSRTDERGLVGDLARVLRDIRTDGTLERIVRRYGITHW